MNQVCPAGIFVQYFLESMLAVNCFITGDGNSFHAFGKIIKVIMTLCGRKRRKRYEDVVFVWHNMTILGPSSFCAGDSAG
jgi:hypothetical protein